MDAIGKALAALLAIPPVRAFLEDVFLRMFAEVLFRSDKDPQFKSQFVALSGQLVTATTEDQKRAILKEMQALRKSPA